ncbi:hypothetical protein Patl1_22825 [Pistacia atlantica]|uniref:Uncharacterized protein n=1 Tax=Pistacia atlantica TaxID=434234 RepID=A0ACC1A146_9ROSI|nr:hypothetical protein Patl1_22825 [Pistacia atlantica]
MISYNLTYTWAISHYITTWPFHELTAHFLSTTFQITLSLSCIQIVIQNNMSSFNHQLKPQNGNDQEDFLFAMELVTGTVLPMTLKAAIELGLLEIMAKASPSHLSSSEIASHLRSKNQDAPVVVDRILRLLASHSILTCKLVTNKDGQAQRLYGLAPVCRYFVQNEDGVSLAPSMLIVQDKASVDCWYHLKDAVLEGSLPFMKAHNGMQGFEYAAQDTRINSLFNQSMHNHTALVMKRILEIYRGFEGLNELMDVGGGFGSNLRLIVSKYPQIKGINFDLPYVIKDAISSPGVNHVGGDMFLEVPKAEYIFMKWILHDWGDDKCLKLLKNCYNALPDSGKVIIVESIMPEFPENDVVTKNVSRLDLCMFNTIPGAKERTKQEFQDLATRAGFAVPDVICRAYCYWVIELYKRK